MDHTNVFALRDLQAMETLAQVSIYTTADNFFLAVLLAIGNISNSASFDSKSVK